MLIRIEGTMNGAKYRQILEENLLQSAKDLHCSNRTMTPSIQPTKHWNGFRART